MPRFAAWIERLAAAELALSALALPLLVLSAYRPAARAPAAFLCVLVAVLVFCSGCLFALDNRARLLDAKLKAGGGLQIRPGKVTKIRRKPAYVLERGHLVKVLDRGGPPKHPEKAEGPRVVGMSMKRTAP